MSVASKRKGSPALGDEVAQLSSKRRFIEGEDVHSVDDEEQLVQTGRDDDAETVVGIVKDTATESTAPTDDRAARFAALRARNAASRKDNLKETKNEARRKAIDTSQLTALNRKRDIAEHKLLQAETEEAGEDFERKRAWDWTIEESERWDKKMAKKDRNKHNVGFADYSQEANKVYKRQLGQMEKAGLDGRQEAYQKEKNEAMERAVRNGGLELVETPDGEVIAIDRDGSYHAATHDPTLLDNKPEKAAVDRLIAEMKKAEEIRLKKRRERGKNDDDGGDVTYINEKNKQFNDKLKRHYDKYTKEIRDNFERGTAL